LEAYMVINFSAHGISWGTHKLAQTLTLIIIIKKKQCKINVVNIKSEKEKEKQKKIEESEWLP